jgi:hypothetical protein
MQRTRRQEAAALLNEAEKKGVVIIPNRETWTLRVKGRAPELQEYWQPRIREYKADILAILTGDEPPC